MLNESELTYWILFTVIPLVITAFTLFSKLGKDKKDNENRITRMESELNDHTNSIKDVKEEQKQQREDTKVILEVSSKIDSLNNRFDKFEDRFYTQQNSKLNQK